MTTQRNILLLIIVILLLLCGFMVKKTSNLRTRLETSEQNTKALSDSVRVEKNKNGQLVSSKNILISDKNHLKELNSELSAELKKEKGKVFQLNKIIATIGETKIKTIYIENTLIEYPEGVMGLEWNYDTIFDQSNSRHISGISKFKLDSVNIVPLTTEINKDVISFKLITGLKEKDDNLEIFVRSDYPGFDVIELDGAVIDPKKHPILKKFTTKKRFSIGPYIGIGVSNTVIPSTQIGIGVQYNLIQF